MQAVSTGRSVPTVFISAHDDFNQACNSFTNHARNSNSGLLGGLDARPSFALNHQAFVSLRRPSRQRRRGDPRPFTEALDASLPYASSQAVQGLLLLSGTWHSGMILAGWHDAQTSAVRWRGLHVRGLNGQLVCIDPGRVNAPVDAVSLRLTIRLRRPT